VNDGEVKCSKCNGTGDNISHEPCDKCLGSGKLDWVSNAMTSANKFIAGSFSAINPCSDIIFYTKDQTEALKICDNVKGKKIVNDKQVYDGFIDFLRDSGHYI
jgi:RecJ-like exonuclease